MLGAAGEAEKRTTLEAEIAALEEEQQEVQALSEARFEELDLALATLQEAHEDGQTDYLDKEQRLNDARLRLRESRARQYSNQVADGTACGDHLLKIDSVFETGAGEHPREVFG